MSTPAGDGPAAPSPVTFTTTVHQARVSATGLVVPPEVVAALGAGGRPPVVVTVGGHTYRSTVGVMSGLSLVPLSAAHRAAAGVEGGQQVVVTLGLDTEPRTVELPAALDEAIGGDDGARASWAALPPGKQKAMALSVTDAKTEATRARRVEAALAALRP